jgi:large-conductance mechanosensitive channel
MKKRSIFLMVVLMFFVLIFLIRVSAEGYVNVGVGGPFCGDSSCQFGAGENCSNCPGDCGVCPFCGDTLCNGVEDCGSCPGDCGACSGRGGGGTVPQKVERIVVTPIFLEVDMIKDTIKTKVLKIENREDGINVNITILELEEILKIKFKDKSFFLGRGGEREIEIEIIAPEEAGIYTGKILINDKEVFVTINVRDEIILLDVEVEIESYFKTIVPGRKLPAIITIFPLENQTEFNVTLNYVIKNFEEEVFFTETERLTIGGKEIFKKSFPTQNMPMGEYILGVELSYEKQTDTSSANFQIQKTEFPLFLSIKFIIDLIIIFLIVVLVIFLILNFPRKKKDKKKKQTFKKSLNKKRQADKKSLNKKRQADKKSLNKKRQADKKSLNKKRKHRKK